MRRHVVAACSVSLAFAAVASAQVPAGPEFRVNTYTTGDQGFPRPAMEPDGDFVVVWPSIHDGDGYGVFGRRFAASGAPRGGEFGVNSYTTASQFQPAVAVGSRGDFVVAWTSAEDGSGMSIQGRRYDGAGNPIGAEFLVNTLTLGNQIWPHVDRASDGRFVVSWRRQGYGIGIRRFDASGSPIGEELNLGNVGGFQGFDDLAVEADGGFLIIREEGISPLNSDIRGMRFDSAGSPVGGAFLVNTYTTGYQIRPSVSVSPAGGFVVAWGSQFGDGHDYGMFARRFDAAGSALGSDFVVNTFTTGRQYGLFEQVALDARGNFVVTWTGPGDGSSNGVFAQRFSAVGARRGAEFRVNTYTTSQQWQAPSIASDAVGNFIVVWTSFGQDGSGQGSFAQRFGGLRPTALRVNTTGNGVLEPGEITDFRPTWQNVNGAAQTFMGNLANAGGPPGGVPVFLNPICPYGTVANGASMECNGPTVSVPNPSPRPVTHWDGTVVESITPDVQGQQKQWLLHVGRSFSDVPTSNPFYRFIETLLHHGVTSGCTATEYCPATATTRDQMAVFVLVAREGAGYGPPPCTTPVFADVPASNPFCRWIVELARRSVVSGCGGGNYCPTAAVTREQMAVFVLRTLDPTLQPPPCTTPIYNDVPASSGFCRWIEELTRRSVVTGCGGGNYCPTSPVTREQMGVFISATFGLTLYGP